MAKFKSGDRVKCVAHNWAMGVCVGDVYTIDDPNSHTSDQGIHVSLKEADCGTPCESVFALHLDLTPEEVIQYFKDGREGELEYVQPNGAVIYCVSKYTGISYLFEGTWRIKPVPQTIDYYGVEIPKPVTKAEAEAEGLTTVYRPKLIGDKTVYRIVRGSMEECNVYFRTEEDALQVGEVMLKPFK